MTKLLHERPTGEIIEYRRFPVDPHVLFLEHRQLQADGRPYDDKWFPVSDSHLLWLQRTGSDIIAILGEGRF